MSSKPTMATQIVVAKILGHFFRLGELPTLPGLK